MRSRCHRQQWLFVLMLTVFLGSTLYAEGDGGYIYGKITLQNGNVYQGVIRWGDEEAFWDDMFNATKYDDVFDYYDISPRDVQSIDSARKSRRGRRFWDFNFWDDNKLIHTFKCRFGDIQKLRLRGSKSVYVTFKNGDELRISGGSNDIGANIYILDDELDEVKLKWRRIKTIEFLPTPKKLDNTFGEPLYGDVETINSQFQGFIQWDVDETLSVDVLDGESEDGDLEIRFGKIRSIERYRRGAMVTLKSGREMYLTGTNDVNKDNSGIVVKDPRYGRVVISWREFKKITFKDDVNGTGPAYDDFKVPKELKGTVKFSGGDAVTGRIIFDLDEGLDLEILEGEMDGIEYMIPFAMIKQIIPEKRWGSEVVLRNGEKLELEESQDVDDNNDGILILKSKDDVKYINWNRVQEIQFE